MIRQFAKNNCATWTEVNQTRIFNNAAYFIRRASPAKVMAIVKVYCSVRAWWDGVDLVAAAMFNARLTRMDMARCSALARRCVRASVCSLWRDWTKHCSCGGRIWSRYSAVELAGAKLSMDT